MPWYGAALGDHVHHRTAGGAELRSEVTGQDGNFLNRFRRWLGFHGRPEKARTGGVHRGAIQTRLECIRRSSVDDGRDDCAAGSAASRRFIG